MKYTIACFIAALSLTTPSQAGEYYKGIDIGYIEHEFSPYYVNTDGSPEATFVNESDGTELGVYAGVKHPFNEALSVAVQARLAVNDSEWTLSLSEPAELRYQQPWTWGLTLIPALVLSEKFSLLTEFGLIQGIIEEKKSGSPFSTYDISETVSGTAFGVGLSYAYNENLNIVFQYRETDFGTFSYRTFDPAGAHIETVWDNPTSEAWSLGLTFQY